MLKRPDPCDLTFRVDEVAYAQDSRKIVKLGSRYMYPLFYSYTSLFTSRILLFDRYISPSNKHNICYIEYSELDYIAKEKNNTANKLKKL